MCQHHHTCAWAESAQSREPLALGQDLEEGEKVRTDEYQIVPFKTTHRIPGLGYSFEEKPRYKADMKKAAEYGLKTGPLIGQLKKMKTIEKLSYSHTSDIATTVLAAEPSLLHDLVRP